MLSQGIRCARDVADDAGPAADFGLGAGVRSGALEETGAALTAFGLGISVGCGARNVTPVPKNAPKMRKLEQITINARTSFVMLGPSSLIAVASTKRVPQMATKWTAKTAKPKQTVPINILRFERR